MDNNTNNQNEPQKEESFLDKAKSAFHNLSEKAGEVWDKVEDKAEDLMEDVKEGAGKAWDATKTAAGNLKDKAEDAWDNMTGDKDEAKPETPASGPGASSAEPTANQPG